MASIHLKPINEVAQRYGIAQEFLIPYGPSIAKIDLSLIKPQAPKGKLILVSSITPTPLGEGKTVTTIGLSQAFNFIG